MFEDASKTYRRTCASSKSSCTSSRGPHGANEHDQALNSAMDVMLGQDPAVIVLARTSLLWWRVPLHDGLQRKYGRHLGA